MECDPFPCRVHRVLIERLRKGCLPARDGKGQRYDPSVDADAYIGGCKVCVWIAARADSAGGITDLINGYAAGERQGFLRANGFKVLRYRWKDCAEHKHPRQA